MTRRHLALTFAFVSIFSFGLARLAAGEDETRPPEPSFTDLIQLSLDDLAELQVTSVSRKPEPLFTAPAAVFVITRDDIRRSGVRTIPDALRLAPGVQVSRIHTSQWAVGVRGFPSRLSRSLLVLIDGRSVYTPLFAGVYWESQDLFLDDIERIEVIRGPGGTLWGENAVNGVINVITRSARDTHGAFAVGRAGSEERGSVGARYGGRAGSSLHYRAYAKGFDRDGGFHPATSEYDEWSGGQGGFRLDWGDGEGSGAASNVTVSGDIYSSRPGQRGSITLYDPPSLSIVERRARISGGNVLARWVHTLGAGAFELQGYYDRTHRNETSFAETRDTYDVEGQVRMPAGARHEIVAGIDARLSVARTAGVETVVFAPARKSDPTVSVFAQDEVTLIPDRLRLIAGSKFEHNDYSGFEAQPNVRALWTPRTTATLWAAVSRAVRTPSMVEHNLDLTVLIDPGTATFARVLRSPEFDSEIATAYEAGGRTQVHPRLWLDIAGFYNDYAELYTLIPGAPFPEAGGRTIIPYVFQNAVEGAGYGGELTASVQVIDTWRLIANYSLLRLDLELETGGADLSQEPFEKASPRHQASLRSQLNLPGDVQVDAFLRHMGELESQRVPEYQELDLRVGWQASSTIELFAVGQNLLDEHHLEFSGASPARVETERQGYGGVALRW